LRSGLAYDPTPIPDSAHRTPRIPSTTRRWLAVGASYQYTPALRFDLSYAHRFVSDRSVNDTDRLGHRLVGTNTSDVNLFGGQVVRSF
ncbi:MAG TPA: transporter, partial [Chromatiales bacterium]|nr:transporter [Chromatiales bacterium]